MKKTRKEKNKEYQRKYYSIHKLEVQKRERERCLVVKRKVLGHYSGGEPICKKCSIKDLRVLSIDHLNNNGSTHRKEFTAVKKGGEKFYTWLKHRNYPKEYQVLCMNCQFIKRYET